MTSARKERRLGKGRLVEVAVLILAVGFMNLVRADQALANAKLFQQIPEGFEKNCNLCHVQPPALNEFGKEFEANGFKFPPLQTEEEKVLAEEIQETGTVQEPLGQETGGTADGKEPVEKLGETEIPVFQGRETVGEVAGGEVKAPEKQQEQAPQVELILPGQATRGEKISLQARVTLGGEPVKGKEVQFFEETDLFGRAEMKLGEASTDALGLAVISYWPRAAEEVWLVARVSGDGQTEAAETRASLALIGSGPLVEKPEGLEVPFLGAWAVLLALVLVWGTYGYVVYSMMQIRRLGEVVEEVRVEEEKKITA